MGRGLSEQQNAILGALGKADETLMAGQVMDALDIPRTASTRASVSRALSNLCRRELVTRWVTEVVLQGDGYRYSLKGRFPEPPPNPLGDMVQVKLSRTSPRAAAAASSARTITVPPAD